MDKVDRYCDCEEKANTFLQPKSYPHALIVVILVVIALIWIVGLLIWGAGAPIPKTWVD